MDSCFTTCLSQWTCFGRSWPTPWGATGGYSAHAHETRAATIASEAPCPESPGCHQDGTMHRGPPALRPDVRAQRPTQSDPGHPGICEEEDPRLDGHRVSPAPREGHVSEHAGAVPTPIDRNGAEGATSIRSGTCAWSAEADGSGRIPEPRPRRASPRVITRRRGLPPPCARTASSR